MTLLRQVACLLGFAVALGLGPACGPGIVDMPTPTAVPDFDMTVIPEDGNPAVSISQPLTVFFTRPVGWVSFDVRRASETVLGQAFIATDRRSATFRPSGNVWRSGALYDVVIEASSQGEVIATEVRFTVVLTAGMPLGLRGNTWDLAATDPQGIDGLAAALDAGPRVLLTLLDLDGTDGSAVVVARFGPRGLAHSGGVPVDINNPVSLILDAQFEGNRATLDEAGMLGMAGNSPMLTLLFDEGANRIEEWRVDGNLRVEDLLPDACIDQALNCDGDGYVELVLGGNGRSNNIGTVPFFMAPGHGAAVAATDRVSLRFAEPIDVEDLSLTYSQINDNGQVVGQVQALNFEPQLGFAVGVSVNNTGFPAATMLRLTASHAVFSPVSNHSIEFETLP